MRRSKRALGTPCSPTILAAACIGLLSSVVAGCQQQKSTVAERSAPAQSDSFGANPGVVQEGPEHEQGEVVSPEHSQSEASVDATVQHQHQFFPARAGCAYLARFVWEGMQGNGTSTLPELQDVLSHFAVWPLDSETREPWPLSNTLSDSTRPIIFAQEDGSRWSWTVVLRGTEETSPRPLDAQSYDLGLPAFQSKIQGLVAEAPDSYYAFVADPLTAIVAAHVIRHKTLPSNPSEAYEAAAFGVNSQLLDRILDEFPVAEFRISADRSMWGLLLQRSDGSNVILAQRGKEIGAGTVMRNLGGWRDKSGKETAEFLAATQTWQTLEDFGQLCPMIPDFPKAILKRPAQEERHD